jgi:hypothetical protein
MHIHIWKPTSFKINDVIPYMISTMVTTNAHKYTKISLYIQSTPSHSVKQNESICIVFPSHFCMNIQFLSAGHS